MEERVLLVGAILLLYLTTGADALKCYWCSGLGDDRACELNPEAVQSIPKHIECDAHFCVTAKVADAETGEVKSFARLCDSVPRTNQCVQDDEFVTCYESCRHDLCNHGNPGPHYLKTVTVSQQNSSGSDLRGLETIKISKQSNNSESDRDGYYNSTSSSDNNTYNSSINETIDIISKHEDKNIQGSIASNPKEPMEAEIEFPRDPKQPMETRESPSRDYKEPMAAEIEFPLDPKQPMEAEIEFSRYQIQPMESRETPPRDYNEPIEIGEEITFDMKEPLGLEDEMSREAKQPMGDENTERDGIKITPYRGFVEKANINNIFDKDFDNTYERNNVVTGNAKDGIHTENHVSKPENHIHEDEHLVGDYKKGEVAEVRGYEEEDSGMVMRHHPSYYVSAYKEKSHQNEDNNNIDKTTQKNKLHDKPPTHLFSDINDSTSASTTTVPLPASQLQPSVTSSSSSSATSSVPTSEIAASFLFATTRSPPSQRSSLSSRSLEVKNTDTVKKYVNAKDDSLDLKEEEKESDIYGFLVLKEEKESDIYGFPSDLELESDMEKPTPNISTYMVKQEKESYVDSLESDSQLEGDMENPTPNVSTFMAKEEKESLQSDMKLEGDTDKSTPNISTFMAKQEKVNVVDSLQSDTKDDAKQETKSDIHSLQSDTKLEGDMEKSTPNISTFMAPGIDTFANAVFGFAPTYLQQDQPPPNQALPKPQQQDKQSRHTLEKKPEQSTNHALPKSQQDKQNTHTPDQRQEQSTANHAMPRSQTNDRQSKHIGDTKKVEVADQRLATHFGKSGQADRKHSENGRPTGNRDGTVSHIEKSVATDRKSESENVRSNMNRSGTVVQDSKIPNSPPISSEKVRQTGNRSGTVVQNSRSTQSPSQSERNSRPGEKTHVSALAPNKKTQPPSPTQSPRPELDAHEVRKESARFTTRSNRNAGSVNGRFADSPKESRQSLPRQNAQEKTTVLNPNVNLNRHDQVRQKNGSQVPSSENNPSDNKPSQNNPRQNNPNMFHRRQNSNGPRELANSQSQRSAEGPSKSPFAPFNQRYSTHHVKSQYPGESITGYSDPLRPVPTKSVGSRTSMELLSNDPASRVNPWSSVLNSLVQQRMGLVQNRRMGHGERRRGQNGERRRGQSENGRMRQLQNGRMGQNERRFLQETGEENEASFTSRSDLSPAYLYPRHFHRKGGRESDKDSQSVNHPELFREKVPLPTFMTSDFNGYVSGNGDVGTVGQNVFEEISSVQNERSTETTSLNGQVPSSNFDVHGGNVQHPQSQFQAGSTGKNVQSEAYLPKLVHDDRLKHLETTFLTGEEKSVLHELTSQKESFSGRQDNENHDRLGHQRSGGFQGGEKHVLNAGRQSQNDRDLFRHAEPSKNTPYNEKDRTSPQPENPVHESHRIAVASLENTQNNKSDKLPTHPEQYAHESHRLAQPRPQTPDQIHWLQEYGKVEKVNPLDLMTIGDRNSEKNTTSVQDIQTTAKDYTEKNEGTFVKKGNLSSNQKLDIKTNSSLKSEAAQDVQMAPEQRKALHRASENLKEEENDKLNGQDLKTEETKQENEAAFVESGYNRDSFDKLISAFRQHPENRRLGDNGQEGRKKQLQSIENNVEKTTGRMLNESYAGTMNEKLTVTEEVEMEEVEAIKMWPRDKADSNSFRLDSYEVTTHFNTLPDHVVPVLYNSIIITDSPMTKVSKNDEDVTSKGGLTSRDVMTSHNGISSAAASKEDRKGQERKTTYKDNLDEPASPRTNSSTQATSTAKQAKAIANSNKTVETNSSTTQNNNSTSVVTVKPTPNETSTNSQSKSTTEDASIALKTVTATIRGNRKNGDEKQNTNSVTSDTIAPIATQNTRHFQDTINTGKSSVVNHKPRSENSPESSSVQTVDTITGKASRNMQEQSTRGSATLSSGNEGGPPLNNNRGTVENESRQEMTSDSDKKRMNETDSAKSDSDKNSQNPTSPKNETQQRSLPNSKLTSDGQFNTKDSDVSEVQASDTVPNIRTETQEQPAPVAKGEVRTRNKQTERGQVVRQNPVAANPKNSSSSFLSSSSSLSSSSVHGHAESPEETTHPDSTEPINTADVYNRTKPLQTTVRAAEKLPPRSRNYSASLNSDEGQRVDMFGHVHQELSDERNGAERVCCWGSLGIVVVFFVTFVMTVLQNQLTL